MCRKWCGGPLMAVNCGTDVTFEGEDNITVYDSSSWAERGFCSGCGSHLFYRL
ncbi:MAG: GFA family protein, partial [Candidatus Dadabacteria bacterium]|nr:GFA family protein [Candidatus Dadabacteria bacterium]